MHTKRDLLRRKKEFHFILLRIFCTIAMILRETRMGAISSECDYGITVPIVGNKTVKFR